MFRERITTDEPELAPVMEFLEGDIPWGYRQGGIYDKSAGILKGNLISPSFVTERELADEITRGFGAWTSFQHYKRSAKKGSIVKATVERLPHDYWGDQYESHEWWSRFHVASQALWSGVPYGFSDYPTIGIGEMFDIREGRLYIVPPTDVDDLRGKCVQRILPQVKEELSSLNSLYELKDIETLSRSAILLGNTLDKVIKMRPSGLIKMMRAVPWKNLRRVASDVYLQYKFNIAPFISDHKAFIASFRAFQKKAQRLVTESATVRTRHTTVVLPGLVHEEEESASRLLGSIYNTVEFWGRQARRVQVEPSKFHVEIQYSYYYTDFQKRHAAGLTLLDLLGVNLNPAILWNAAKWTFAVDWVGKVSNYLDRLKMANMEPVIIIHRCLWSHKLTRHTACYVRTDQNGIVPVSTVLETSYSRNLFVPDSHWFETSGLNSTEWSLIAALAGSRR